MKWLHGLDADEFLKEYWQKKPLFLKGGFDGWENPVSPDELAGLACEETADARIVLEKGGEYPWQVKYAPFEETDFTSLKASHWSLLVRRVDQWVPDVATLRDRFKFIPSWRFEDVMVSYAVKGGGVGAHVDSYDVFLIQGYGTRQWLIGNKPLRNPELKPLNDIAILSDFQYEWEWSVEPGDVIYLPPGFAHAGTALSDCMTYSIGFRAPPVTELLSGYVEALIERMDPTELYADPDLTLQLEPGQISQSAIDRVEHYLKRLVLDRSVIESYFGKLVTHVVLDSPLPENEVVSSVAELLEILNEGGTLCRTESARIAFVSHPGGAATLFVSGEEYFLESGSAIFAKVVSEESSLDITSLGPFVDDETIMNLLLKLVVDGQLYIADDA